MTKGNWWNGDERIAVPHSQFVHEQEKSSGPVVYDHEGNPYSRPRQAIGFDLSGKKE